jgi:trehalose 6-phosphate phosphatase
MSARGRTARGRRHRSSRSTPSGTTSTRGPLSGREHRARHVSKHGREVIAPAGLEGKPNPDLFPEAAFRLDLPRARAAVVEDALSGVHGRAARLGLVVGVDRGANREAIERRGVRRRRGRPRRAERRGDPGPADGPPAAGRAPARGARRLAGRRAAVFLDCECTLTPVVAHPSLAVLAQDAREVLRRLAHVATVAVVGGRALGGRARARRA